MILLLHLSFYEIIVNICRKNQTIELEIFKIFMVFTDRIQKILYFVFLEFFIVLFDKQFKKEEFIILVVRFLNLLF